MILRIDIINAFALLRSSARPGTELRVYVLRSKVLQADHAPQSAEVARMDPLDGMGGVRFTPLHPTASRRTIYSGGLTDELFRMRRAFCNRAISRFLPSK